jgi:hypothetical protein
LIVFNNELYEAAVGGVNKYNESTKHWSPAGTGITSDLISGLTILNNTLITGSLVSGLYKFDHANNAWTKFSNP